MARVPKTVARRHAEADATLRLVEAADAPIVGLALTGIEGHRAGRGVHRVPGAARRLGLGFTVHAGEMGPPGSIVEALDVLDADRIDHGVAAIRDPELLERLVRDQVVLDLCPSSNVGTGAFPPLPDRTRARVSNLRDPDRGSG